MNQYLNQNCPLCNNPAEYRLNDSDKYKVFHCHKCKVFAMSDTVESRITKHSEKFIKALSDKSSKLKEDQFLRIYSGTPGSDEKIKTEVQLRKNWNT